MSKLNNWTTDERRLEKQRRMFSWGNEIAVGYEWSFALTSRLGEGYRRFLSQFTLFHKWFEGKMLMIKYATSVIWKMKLHSVQSKPF